MELNMPLSTKIEKSAINKISSRLVKDVNLKKGSPLFKKVETEGMILYDVIGRSED